MAECIPGIDGRIVGQACGTVVPGTESNVHYRDETLLASRPHREAIREEIADHILLMLGAPRVKVELNRQNLSLAVDYALKLYEQNAPRKEFDWYYFDATPGVSRYKLPPEIGLIRQVYFSPGRCDTQATQYGVMGYGNVMPYYAGFFPGTAPWPSSSTTTGYGFPTVGNMGEWTLFRGYQSLFQRLMGAEPSWDYAPDNAIILHPNPMGPLAVSVHYLQRKRDWQDVDPWIKSYALAMAKEMLGRIRSKFDRFISPSGGVTLDGDKLLAESQQEKEKLEQAILDRFQISHCIPTTG